MRHLRLTNGEAGDNNKFAMSIKSETRDQFGTMFRVMRDTLKQEGWTQRRLCAALGRSESWLSKILNAGRGMDITDLLLICEVTGIPPAKLLAGYPCPAQPEGEEDRIARRLRELLPPEIIAKLLEQVREKPKP